MARKPKLESAIEREIITAVNFPDKMETFFTGTVQKNSFIYFSLSLKTEFPTRMIAIMSTNNNRLPVRSSVIFEEVGLRGTPYNLPPFTKRIKKLLIAIIIKNIVIIRKDGAFKISFVSNKTILKKLLNPDIFFEG